MQRDGGSISTLGKVDVRKSRIDKHLERKLKLATDKATGCCMHPSSPCVRQHCETGAFPSAQIQHMQQNRQKTLCLHMHVACTPDAHRNQRWHQQPGRTQWQLTAANAATSACVQPSAPHPHPAATYVSSNPRCDHVQPLAEQLTGWRLPPPAPSAAMPAGSGWRPAGCACAPGGRPRTGARACRCRAAVLRPP